MEVQLIDIIPIMEEQLSDVKLILDKLDILIDNQILVNQNLEIFVYALGFISGLIVVSIFVRCFLKYA